MRISKKIGFDDSGESSCQYVYAEHIRAQALREGNVILHDIKTFYLYEEFEVKSQEQLLLISDLCSFVFCLS